MEDFRVDIKVRNNRILERIQKSGYSSLTQFCKAIDVSYGSLSKIINLKEGIYTKRGNIRPNVIKISKIFGCDPSDLFSEAQEMMELKTNKTFKLVSDAEVEVLLENKNKDLIEPDEVLYELQFKENLDSVLDTLTPREVKVLKLRFGIDDDEHTLAEIGCMFDVTANRIRQIEQKALRKLRHPSRSEMLEEFLNK